MTSTINSLLNYGEIESALDDQGILTIRLNRPEKLNALTRPMLATLEDIFTAAGMEPKVRVIVFTAIGRAFCSGADAHSLASSAKQTVEQRLSSRPRFTARMSGIFKPTICAVNGICAGAGLHFVADSDIVIASTAAQFTDTHVNIGQVTALEPIGLARRIALSAVLRMVVLGKAERLNAEKALEVNLVSEIHSPEALLPRAYELARTIADVSPTAVQTSLRALWGSYELPLSAAYDKGYEMLMRHRDHADASEGPAAFLEKRSPKWSVD